MSATPEPWERQLRESSLAYQAFCVYRDMGAVRSLSKAAGKLGSKKGRLEAWCSRWHWVARAQAWDDLVDRERRAAQIDAVIEMNRRQAALAANYQAKLIESLQNTNWQNISALEQARILDVASKIERLARGAETARTATEHSGKVAVDQDLRAMTDKEITDALRKQLEAAGMAPTRVDEFIKEISGGGAGETEAHR